MKLKLLVALLLVIGLGEAIAQSPEVSRLLHQYLTIQQKRLGFNGVVLVGKSNKIIYNEAIGEASLELGIPLTLNSGFKIASISKSFTALLVIKACNEGKLTLDDSLGTFFSQLKDPSWRKITIDQLLSHRSGIPHNEGITDYWTTTSLLALNRQQALTEIFNLRLLFAPGTDAKYSSPGYFLLAAILEDIYKQSYGDILKYKITTPLGMSHTGVYNTTSVITGMSSSYHLLNDSFIVAPYRSFALMKGSGDMYSTADDLLRWTSSFGGDTWQKEGKQIFSSHSGKALHNNGDMYGYGWFIRAPTKELKNAYYHGGGSYGCSAIAVWYPQEQVSVIILSNVSVLPVNDLWRDVEKIVFNLPFNLPEQRVDIKLSSEELKKLEGDYLTNPHRMELKIVSNNNHLYARLGNNPLFEIYPTTPVQFYGKKVNVEFTFIKNEGGLITGLQTTMKGQITTFNRR